MDDFGECKYGGLQDALLPKVAKPGKSGWCKALNSRGRCTDQINPGGHCACNKKCKCQDPYRWFQRHAHLPAEAVAQVTSSGATVGGAAAVIPSAGQSMAFRGEEGKSRLKKRRKKSNKRAKNGRSNKGSKKG